MGVGAAGSNENPFFSTSPDHQASNDSHPSFGPKFPGGVSSLLVDALPAPKAKISDLKQTRSKDLLVTFRTDQEKSSFQREIAGLDHLKDKLILSEPSERNPSVIIYNIPKSTTESSIQQGLRQIFSKDEDPAQHFHFFQNIQSVPINWTPFKISQFIHYQRCNNCQSFGHMSRDCFFSAPNCVYCGGHRVFSSCNAEHPSCINRYYHNKRHGTSLSLSHSSRDKSCPCLLVIKENYLNSIEYS
ncbi:hypothetical protein AVEN_202386-1 [Araneus ventricosus]|uniref:CCHC-type domain-containing protein n=1 Tax=Araneus ventricosus TaxID=182803 RepID=A0A4Y2IXV0_ARAVE|nr:hypothetical protein AVEN_202386-1 [Araneus ventricosus]